MKRTPLLHAALSEVIAGLGHGDMLVLADAGLPRPDGPRHIDLALTRGVPSFEQVLAAVLAEMQVERWVVAAETRTRSPAVHDMLARRLAPLPAEELSHEAFKLRTARARATVRTGECTPYANVILVAGVVF